MPLIIKYGCALWKKSIDLLQITAGNYSALDKLPKLDKDRAIKTMVKKLPHSQIMVAIEHLSAVCFDVKKELFIRQGSSSFLADLIKAYIDSHDGVQFAQAYLEHGEEGLIGFRFTPPSTDVLQLLWKMANDLNSVDVKYAEYIPTNISNKIWQPIILERALKLHTLDPTQLCINMQRFANNSELQKAILMSNLVTAQTSSIAATSVC